MNRTARIAAVTAGFMVGGATFGALAGMIAFTVCAAMTEGTRFVGRETLTFVGIVGALFGGVLLPLAAWAFLRRVALWLTFAGTLLGTIAGGVAGWMIPRDQVLHGTLGAVIGFLAATLLLRLTAGRAAAVEGRRVSVS